MTPSSPLTVLLAGDNAVMRAGLAAHLRRASGSTVLESRTGAEAVKTAGEELPDAVLLDVHIPASGADPVRELSRLAPVVALAFAGDREEGRAAVGRGARAFLQYGSFTPPELAEVVAAVVRPGGEPAGQADVDALVAARGPATAAALRSESGLTERESQVIRLVAGGMSNSMISDHLVVSEKTVKNHINHIYAKLHVRNRAEAVQRWKEAESALV
ncbi:response regulator transcription factor [Nocardiopsis sp. CNT-189]|uniref:response regulator transcription factor n=1 Tax=Nocardiopsis oceanisediminis TaxID=2816862 RepID=UPI003B3210BD